MGRTRKQVHHIDTIIRQYYPFNGASWCARELKESVEYIQSRAKILRVRLNDSVKGTPGVKSDKVATPAKMRKLQNRNEILQLENHQLKMKLHSKEESLHDVRRQLIEALSLKRKLVKQLESAGITPKKEVIIE